MLITTNWFQEEISMRNELQRIIIGKHILEFIEKLKKPTKIGIAYNEYIKENREFCFSYKTFQRYIDEFAERDLINVKKIIGGEYGTTRLISSKTNIRQNQAD